MFKIKYIIQGFKHLMFSNKLNKSKLDLYNKRYEICLNCEKYSCKLKCCKECGCFCKAKVKVDYNLDDNNKSIDGCPLKKW